ncbi:MAG TPA: hydrogen gas-evolving membrane-bound hydrogenase subunit E [Nitrolancea sp.]
MPNGFDTVAPLILATAGLVLTAGIGSLRYRLAPPLAVATATLAFLATLWGWWQGTTPVDLAWAPTLQLRLAFRLDGLAILYSLLATGIGLAVLIYAWRYLPLHLAHEGQDPATATRFYGFMLLFMASMLGLVAAQDLILIFVFWDLTAITSYFLIGFDRESEDARDSALMALLITGVSAVLFMIGALMLYQRVGTFQLDELRLQIGSGWYFQLAVLLIVVAALAKSAQVPLHFWLPRAMAAPTPVSAYLHSAAMVAAGVFLLSRFYSLIEPSRLLLDGLILIGFLSIFTGGLLALSATGLKQLLAYSTIAQYGYVVVMLGIGGATGVAAASFYVIAHALGKSALFLTAGAVTEATGENELSNVGGLARSLPWLAAGSAIAAADLAALPLTIGFFKDELYFKTALERGWPLALLAVLGAALTFAYLWRFWSGIFLGPVCVRAVPLSGRLIWPVVALGALALAGGFVPLPATHLAEAAGEATVRLPISLHVGYHLELSELYVMALAAWLLGISVIRTRSRWGRVVTAVAVLGRRIGPERQYWLGLGWLVHLSHVMLDFEVRDLRRRISTILVPAAVLAILGLLASPETGMFRVGLIARRDLLLLLLMGLASIAALAATRPAHHLPIILALSSVGFTLAAIYAGLGAPDVALVAVLVEMFMTIIFTGALTLFPNDALRKQIISVGARSHMGRDITVGICSALFAFVIVWSVLSRPASAGGVSHVQVRLTPIAHAQDVVTAILADFRGLDTAGEITVIVIVLIGVVALLREERRV